MVVIWEASDRLCGKRLRPLVPVLIEAMERHGHLRPSVRRLLLSMSAATIDRRLRSSKAVAGRPDSDLQRLARPATRLLRSRPGGAQRPDDARQLRTDIGA